MARLHLTSDPAADTLLSEEPFALLTGMLLDQQIPMETAFAGPRKIADRLGEIDPGRIAECDPEEFARLCAETPAVHRFPGSMAKRIQDLARAIVEDYGGDTAALWTRGEADGAEVLRRLKALPGFGEQKAKIFLALLGKQYGVTPKGWRTAAKQPVKNVELWQALDHVVSTAGHQIEWRWVKGHAGDPGNERADALANKGVEQALGR